MKRFLFKNCDYKLLLKEIKDSGIKIDAVIVKYTKALYKARNNILDTIENFIKEVEDKAGINQDKKENK